MSEHCDGKWARAILAAQQADDTWGSMFHSMAQPGNVPLTTEQALRRLHALGFTIADEPIRRIVDTMAACLRGERKIDAYWEKGIDWAMYEPLMLAAWIRRFDREQPDALTYAQRWAKVIGAAFSDGDYDDAAYLTAYEDEFRRKERHPKPIRLTAFYHAMLLPDVLSSGIESALVRHLLTRPDGMYYIYPKPLIHPPLLFAAKETSYWLAAIELLAEYPAAREQLHFAAAYLHMNATPDGQWDLGPKANDKIYFPLSDSWRTEALRKADFTERILTLLDKIEKGD